MTIQTRQACGFNNATAVLSYSFDDAVTPPVVTEIRLSNTGPRLTITVEISDLVTNVLVKSYTLAANTGADMVLPRSAPGNQPSIQREFGGDLFMVDSLGKDGSHGWAFPFRYRCQSS